MFRSSVGTVGFVPIVVAFARPPNSRGEIFDVPAIAETTTRLSMRAPLFFVSCRRALTCPLRLLSPFVLQLIPRSSRSLARSRFPRDRRARRVVLLLAAVVLFVVVVLSVAPLLAWFTVQGSRVPPPTQ